MLINTTDKINANEDSILTHRVFRHAEHGAGWVTVWTVGCFWRSLSGCAAAAAV